jgi:hypothetical protein
VVVGAQVPERVYATKPGSFGHVVVCLLPVIIVLDDPRGDRQEPKHAALLACINPPLLPLLYAVLSRAELLCCLTSVILQYCSCSDPACPDGHGTCSSCITYGFIVQHDQLSQSQCSPGHLYQDIHTACKQVSIICNYHIYNKFQSGICLYVVLYVS